MKSLCKSASIQGKEKSVVSFQFTKASCAKERSLVSIQQSRELLKTFKPRSPMNRLGGKKCRSGSGEKEGRLAERGGGDETSWVQVKSDKHLESSSEERRQDQEYLTVRTIKLAGWKRKLKSCR